MHSVNINKKHNVALFCKRETHYSHKLLDILYVEAIVLDFKEENSILQNGSSSVLPLIMRDFLVRPCFDALIRFGCFPVEINSQRDLAINACLSFHPLSTSSLRVPRLACFCVFITTRYPSTRISRYRDFDEIIRARLLTYIFPHFRRLCRAVPLRSRFRITCKMRRKAGGFP